MIVHFICRGNVNRSAIAETYLRSLQLEGVVVRSSGTIADLVRQEYELFLQGLGPFLETHYGIGKYVKLQSEQLTQERVNGADITICMNPIVRDEAQRIVELPSNTVTWDVTDNGETGRIIGPHEDKYKYTQETYLEIAQKIDELVRSPLFTELYSESVQKRNLS